MTSNDISFARSFKASKAGFAETTGVSTAGFEYLWQKGLIVTASVFLYVLALNFMTYQAIGTLALPKHIRPKPGMFDCGRSIQALTASKLLCHFRFKEPTCMVWNLRLDLICSRKAYIELFQFEGGVGVQSPKPSSLVPQKLAYHTQATAAGHRPNAQFWITNAFFTLHASG